MKPPFSSEFMKKYRSAQRDRMNRLIDIVSFIASNVVFFIDSPLLKRQNDKGKKYERY